MNIRIRVILEDAATNEELKSISSILKEEDISHGFDGIERSALKAFGTIHAEVSQCLLGRQQHNYVPEDKKKRNSSSIYSKSFG